MRATSIRPLPGQLQPGALPGRAPGQRQGPPPARDRWYTEPAKVFDNLYFVGEKEFSAWAVVTSEGIIVIDAIYDYSVEEEVVGGLKKMGLDPTQDQVLLVSHAHADHYAGARFLQDRFHPRVILSAADWDFLERTTTPSRAAGPGHGGDRWHEADAWRHDAHALPDAGTYGGYQSRR